MKTKKIENFRKNRFFLHIRAKTKKIRKLFNEKQGKMQFFTILIWGRKNFKCIFLRFYWLSGLFLKNDRFLPPNEHFLSPFLFTFRQKEKKSFLTFFLEPNEERKISEKIKNNQKNKILVKNHFFFCIFFFFFGNHQPKLCFCNFFIFPPQNEKL